MLRLYTNCNISKRQKMASVRYIVTSLSLVILTLHTHIEAQKDCPRVCSCFDGLTADIYQVDCSSQNLLELPAKSIPTMTSSINLNSNRMTSVSQAMMRNFRWLINLNMSHNEISWIEDDSFRYMSRLDILDLSHNKLTTVVRGVFNGLASLKELNLANNELTDVGEAFNELVNLTKLDLSGNRLTALTEFTLRDLKSLRYLHLSNNRLQFIDRKAFRYQHKLLYLVLKNNPLNIHRFYFHSLLLSYVDLSECQLTQVPGGLSDSIRYLQLRRNNISRLFADSFADCPYVNILVLDENKLSSIDESTFEKMFHLQQLWLNDNHLDKLPQNLPASLRRLLADGNRIRRVENVFPPRSQMSMISLVGNEIRQVEKDAFSNLATLHNLDLSDNYITRIYSGTFTQNSQLRSLRYSKNPLQYLAPGCLNGLTDLQSLSLGFIRRGLERDQSGSVAEGDGSGTQPIQLHSDLFSPIQRLQRLEMDNSPSLVSAVLSSDRLLEGLRSVIELSLISSDLTTITSHFIHKLPSLAALRISSSRWHCDQSLIWFRDFLKSTRVKVEEKNDIKCFTPRLLHGRPIISLTDDEFAAATTLSPPTIKQQPVYRPTDPPEEVPVSKPFNEDGWMEYEVMEPDRIPGNIQRGATEKEKGRKKPDRVNKDNDEETDSDTQSIFLIAISRAKATVTPAVWAVGGVEAADRDTETKRGGKDYGSDKSDGEFEMRIMVAVVTIVATCVVAAIIVALIIYVWNRQQQQLVDDADLTAAAVAAEQQLQQKENHERTVISYKNRSGVLYFSSSTSGGSRGKKSSAAAAELRCEQDRGDSSSSSQSLLTSQNTTPTLVTSAQSLPEVHLINKPAKYYKTRVYKWEDF